MLRSLHPDFAAVLVGIGIPAVPQPQLSPDGSCVTVCNLDCFIELVFTQRSGNWGAKALDCLRAAWNAIARSIKTPIDQADMNEERRNDGLSKDSHLTPHLAGVEADCGLRLLLEETGKPKAASVATLCFSPAS